MYTNSQVAKRDIFTEAELTFANAQGRLAHITVYFHTRSCKRLGHNSQSIDRFRGSNAFVMPSVQLIWLKGYHRYWSRSCFAHWLEFSEDRIYPCGWIGMMSRPKRRKKMATTCSVFSVFQPVYACALIVGVDIGTLSSALTASAPRGLKISSIYQKKKMSNGGLPALAAARGPRSANCQMSPMPSSLLAYMNHNTQS